MFLALLAAFSIPAASSALPDPAVFTHPAYRPGLVRHVVLFRYRPAVTPARREAIRRAFLALRTQATRDGRPYILDIETGAQNSREGADRGLEQGFIVSFRSEGDRNYYVGAPVVADPRYQDAAHARFKALVGPALDLERQGVLVFDFTVDFTVDAAPSSTLPTMTRR